MLKTLKIILIFIFLTKFMCAPIVHENKTEYNYQCYKYYDGRKDPKPDEEYCKKCLCIDTTKIRLW